MKTTYADDDTLRAARARYFEVNQFGVDGGYDAPWVDFKLGPLPFPFPNTEPRKVAVRYHDLHHVLTGYDTDIVGEFEISAWEIGAGCRRMIAAWQLNLGGLAAGLFIAPRRVWRAFLRGRASDTLYGADLDALLDQRVGPVRDRHIRAARAATGADVALFVLASLAGLVLGTISFWLFVPLVPLGVLWGQLHKRRALTS